MKKIISLFKRDYAGNRLVIDEIVPGAQWVTAGQGTATRKYDGVATMVRDKKLYKRLELSDNRIVKGGIPEGWEPADERDPNTGKQMGWIPVGDGPEDRWLRQAAQTYGVAQGLCSDGTYEFLGPKSQGNVEGFGQHTLLNHATDTVWVGTDPPRTFDALRAFFEAHPAIEGIVWHHPDGRMVKIKGKDFGVRRVAKIVVPA